MNLDLFLNLTILYIKGGILLKKFSTLNDLINYLEAQEDKKLQFVGRTLEKTYKLRRRIWFK